MSSVETVSDYLLSLRERRGERALKFKGAPHVIRPLTLTLSRRERGADFPNGDHSRHRIDV
jgi:hypothetical protein